MEKGSNMKQKIAKCEGCNKTCLIDMDPKSEGRTNKKNPSYRFVQVWSWPRNVEILLEKLMKGEGMSPQPDPEKFTFPISIHVCSGDSKLGDVKIDLFNEHADIKADMFNLPIRPEIAQLLLCDPPWHLPYHVRHKLIYQLRNVLKPGGRLIFNCIWSPKVRGIQIDEKIYAGLPNATWRNASLLFTARRYALPS